MAAEDKETTSRRVKTIYFLFGAVLGGLAAIGYMTGTTNNIHLPTVVLAALVAGALAARFGPGFFKAVRRLWFP